MPTITTESHSSRALELSMEIIEDVLRLLLTTTYIYSFLTFFYVYHYISTGICRIPVHGNYLQDLLKEPVFKFLRFCHITVYYDNDNDLKRDQDRYQLTYKNLQFCRTRNYDERLEIDNDDGANNQLSLTDRTTTTELIPAIEERISSDQSTNFGHSSTRPEGKHGFFVKNIDEIDPCYICQSCKLVLREPYQLKCGHRQCHSCIYVQNNTISCSACSETSTINNIWLDNAFQNELDCLSTFCIICDWRGLLKTYQGYLDQNHLDNFIICFLCNQQVERIKIHEHYLTETYQRLVPNILLRLQSRQIQKNLEFSQVNDMISNATNDVTEIQDDVQRIANECCSYKMSLQLLNQEFDSSKMLAEENENHVRVTRAVQNFSLQAIESLKQRVEDRQVQCFDGTLEWKISDVQQKMDDAKFERRRSIYSPEFSSSPVGYRMRLRLFLNGINHARGTHLSLYFILMRGEYDALLKWPFHFKVKFSLLDQSSPKDNQHHFSDLFWSDTSSPCFQHPQLEMNEAYGIEKFVPLDQNRYIQNDTMFIRTEVDFTSIPPVSPSDSGSMSTTDEQHTDTNDDDMMRSFYFQ